MRAESTLDNRWGDLDAPPQRGIVPDPGVDLRPHRGDSPAHQSTTFGPFAEMSDASGELDTGGVVAVLGSKDPIHDQSLGPNGYV